MRARFMVLVGLAGCRTIFGIGDPELIDASRVDAVDAPPDTPPNPGDLDGDGVLNADDNCPTTANADQRDFDHDGHGDACDHCPHLASAQDPDADGDGVGDDCDPRPTQAGDTRVAWFGFYDANDIAGWSTLAGTWSVTSAGLFQPDTAGTATINAPMLTSSSHLQLVAQLDVMTLGTSPAIDLCSAVFNTRYYCCNLDASKFTAVAMEDSGTTTTSIITWPGTFAAGDSITITQDTNTGLACAAKQGAIAQSTSIGAVDGPGVFGFYSHQMSIAVRYLFVVAIGQ